MLLGISSSAVEPRERGGGGVSPYFTAAQLSGLAETDSDLDGTVHFKRALWDGARVHTSVYKTETVFSRREGVEGGSGRALHFDFTLKI